MKPAQLQKMTLKQLKDLKRRVDQVIKSRRGEERKALRLQFKQLAAEAGYSMKDVVGQKGSKGPLIAKYANPKNPDETWSGRGRMPNWLKAKLKRGVKLKDFEI